MKAFWAVVAGLLLLGAPLAAAPGANLAGNPSFENGTEGWDPLTPATTAVIDPDTQYDGRLSMRIDGNGGRGGVGQKEIRFEAPLPSQLACRYAGKRTKGSPDAVIGLDLAITLDDGTKLWYLPPALSLAAGDTRWTEKSGVYRAPDGKRVAALRVLCVNTNSQDTAWFDAVSVSVTPRTAESDVVLLDLPGEGTSRAADLLTRARVRFERMPWEELGPPCKLAVVAGWKESDELPYLLRRHHFLGGRLLLLGAPSTPATQAVSQYLFDKPISSMGGPPKATEDGRAVWAADPSTLTPEALSKAVAELLKAPFPPEEPPSQVRQTRYQVKGGRLLEEGRPLLWRAMGAHYLATIQAGWLDAWKADAALYRSLGLNGVVLYLYPYTTSEALRQALDIARENGLRAVVWICPGYPDLTQIPVAERAIRRFASCADHPAFMAWELSDDTYNPYYPILERTAQIVRAQAPGLLITSTLMDTRHPEQVSTADWQRWRKLLDYPLPYVYPLQRGEHFAPAAIKGGLEDVELLSEGTRSAFGPDAYIQQWCQAHLQPFAYPPSGLSPKEYFAPTPEQIRLLTYMTLASGSRGIAYFSPVGFTDEALGVGRRAEVGILWHELAPVEDLLAGGERAAAQVTGDPSVRATAYRGDNATLVVAVKHGKTYHRYVDAATAEGVRIQVGLQRAPAGTLHAFAVSYPRVRELPCSVQGATAEVRLDRVQLTELVLLTTDAAVSDAAAARMRETLPRAARWAVEALCDAKVKTEVILEYLGGTVTGETRQYAALGKSSLARATEALAKGNLEAAFTASREGMSWYRRLQAGSVQQAEELIAARGLPAEAWQSANLFASLPRFYETYADGRKVEPWAMGTLARTRLETELKAIPR